MLEHVRTTGHQPHNEWDYKTGDNEETNELNFRTSSELPSVINAAVNNHVNDNVHY
jgi:hypothetical protein